MTKKFSTLILVIASIFTPLFFCSATVQLYDNNKTLSSVSLVATGLEVGSNASIYLKSKADATPVYSNVVNKTVDSNGNITADFNNLAQGGSYTSYVQSGNLSVATYDFTTPGTLQQASSPSSGSPDINISTNPATDTGKTSTVAGLSSTNGGLVPTCPDTGCGFPELMILINNVIHFLLVYLASPLAAIIVCYAGWIYISAGGSSEKVGKAKTMLLNVVIGYVIALAAWLIIHTIITSLGIDPGIQTFLVS